MAKKESKFKVIDVPTDLTDQQESEEVSTFQQPPVTDLTVPKTFKVGDMEVNKETLIAQRTKDVELVINGVDDTKGYKAANALRAQYRTLRTTLEKYRKDVSKPHQEFVKQLKIATDELGAEALIGEQYFDTLMTEIDNEKQRIKDEEAKLQQQRIQSRINQLFDYGARFDGETYSFSYDESLIITAVNVSEFPDGDFADFVADVQDSYDKEQERTNDQLAADELKKEQERIQAEKDKALVDAANEKVRKVREKELIRVLGYSFSEVDGEYSHPDIPIPVRLSTVAESDDESWEALIYAIEHYEAVVTPKPDPVVEEEPEHLPAIGFTGPGSPGSSFEVRHFSEFENLEEDEEQTALVENEDIEFAEVIMQFNVDQPFTDVDISSKMFQRFYPKEYADKAMAGIEVIANSGKVQDLCWMILAKGS